MEEKLKIKELRKLPRRKCCIKSKYNSLLIINSGRKHDSGYALMYVIGIDDGGKPKEIAAACDDINWFTNLSHITADIRTDMLYPSGIIRMWSRECYFLVGWSLSSIDIELIKRNDCESI